MAKSDQTKINKIDKTQSSVGLNNERAYIKPPVSPYADILSLQGMVGNGNVTKLLSHSLLQPKLKISQPDDSYEREADQVAEQIMRTPEPILDYGSTARNQITNELVRESVLQTKSIPGDTPQVSQNSASKIQSLKGRGQPLSDTTRSFFEPRFGQDFSQVRIYNDNQAAQTAKTINARAFTTGNNIVFGAGEYSPVTDSGRLLLAHELTHFLQQKNNVNNSIIQRKSVNKEKKIIVGYIQYFDSNGVFLGVAPIQAYPSQVMLSYGVYPVKLVKTEELNVTLEFLKPLSGIMMGEVYGDDPDVGVEELRKANTILLTITLGSPLPEYSTIVVGKRETKKLAKYYEINADFTVLDKNRELSFLYLIHMQHFTKLSLTPEIHSRARDGLTDAELITIIGEDRSRKRLTELFTQGWLEFKRAGEQSTEIFSPLIERIIEQDTRGNLTATMNRMRIGYSFLKNKKTLGIIDRSRGFLLYDELGLPILHSHRMTPRDTFFVPSNRDEKLTPSEKTELTHEEELDLYVLNVFAQALGAGHADMVAEGVSAAIRHIEEVKQRVENGLLPEVLANVGKTIGILIIFLLGHSLARFLINMKHPLAFGIGIGIELFLRGLGYIMGIEFLSDTWEVLMESAFHMSRVRDDKDGKPTALSYVHMDRAAEPIRHLINNTAMAMTFVAFAGAVRGIRGGRQGRWGKQRGYKFDWLPRVFALRLLLFEPGRGVYEGIGARSFQGYGNSPRAGITEVVPRSGSSANLTPETGIGSARGTLTAPKPSTVGTQASTPEAGATGLSPVTAQAAGGLGSTLTTPAIPSTHITKGASATAESELTETGQELSTEEYYGDQLVRLFLSNPHEFNVNALSTQHQRVMFDTFLRNPQAYIQATETIEGEALLNHLIEEAVRQQRESQQASETQATASSGTEGVVSTATETVTVTGQTTIEPVANESVPSPQPVLDPNTLVTVNLNSNIYYLPGTRYHGATGPQWEEMTVAQAEARNARSTHLQPVRARPPSGVYHTERSAEGIVLYATLGWRQARAGLERFMRSAGEYAIDLIQGWQRAHASGAGLGAESGEAIRLAPEFVNQILQNRGIERFLRDLRDIVLPEGRQIHVTTIVETHPGTLQLKSIEYKIQTIGNIESLDVRIEVTREGISQVSVRLPGSDEYTKSDKYNLTGEPVRDRSQ